MSGPVKYAMKPKPERRGEAKTRACLKCREAFVSAWAGERVCPTCKRGTGWRLGSLEPVYAGHRVGDGLPRL
jgi:hypothetical protein